MENKASWNDLMLVVRGLISLRNGPPIQGVFEISSPDRLKALLACLNSEQDTRLLLKKDEDPLTLQVGQTVEVELQPRFGFGILIQDVKTLLHVPGARVSEPPQPFLLLEDFVSSTDEVNKNHLLTRYRLVLSLIQTLKQCAAFLDTDQEVIIFIKDGKFEVPIEYSDNILQTLQDGAIQNLITIIPTGNHEEQCKSILAESVVNMTKHLPANQRFSYLVENAAELKKRYEQGYNLFASGFSYDKVRDQVEAARIEYTGKIHKVISDIQNQLLGIPVATIIVATQMKNVNSINYEFWINIAVLVGCWVFATLMVFLLINQSHTLGVITIEISRQRRQLEKDYSSIASTFSDTFSYLASRVATQRKVLRTVYVFVAIGFVLSHVVFFKITMPARNWLNDWLPCLYDFL